MERRRSARTLESLSTALGLHPQHLEAVLHGRTPPSPGEPVTQRETNVMSRLDGLERRLDDITDRLDDLKAGLAVRERPWWVVVEYLPLLLSSERNTSEPCRQWPLPRPFEDGLSAEEL
ncbi:hypothetical protein [Kibdelosporangium aridum]|uniref:hypothetical protein n=1 Tax=Kibdelosporangium aridum TaxID=2030 RepID=UPI002E141629